MIILITYKDERGNVKVSHGMNYETLENIVLPTGMPPEYFNAKFSVKLGEYFISEFDTSDNPNEVPIKRF